MGLCLGALYLFYGRMIDVSVYRRFSGERFQGGVNNATGEFRGNLLSSPLFAGPAKRVAVVGSSFTMWLGHFEFALNGETYHSASLGLGSNPLLAGLRAGAAVIDTPGVDILVLGISPLNCGPIESADPFKGQLYAGVNALGFNLPSRPYSEARPLSLASRNLLRLFVQPEMRYQFREFLFHAATGLGLKSRHDPHWSRETAFTPLAPADLAAFPARFAAWVRGKTSHSLPGDRKNGENDVFEWTRRGVFETLAEGGDVSRAIVGLQQACQARNVRFVLYNTPTVSHQEAPLIYPEGFLERYRQVLADLAARHHIEYYDFSDLFPWTDDFYLDFIHLTFEARKMLHQQLLCAIARKEAAP